jgi:hypothetical protein
LTAGTRFVDPVLIVLSADAPVSRILQIYRERLKPDSDAPYSAIEEDTARVAAALACPHPYLGAESLTGTKEVWWFNAYASAAEQNQVYAAYAQNAPLMAALQQTSQRKAALTLEPVEVFAHYRPDLSVGEPWVLGRGRFLVVTIAKKTARVCGTVFEAADGTQFILTSAQTREQAAALRRLAGAATHILAVRPLWSCAAKEWIAMDPGFWR